MIKDSNDVNRASLDLANKVKDETKKKRKYTNRYIYVRVCIYIKREKKRWGKYIEVKPSISVLHEKEKWKERKPATHTHRKEKEKTHSDWEEETKREI